MNRAFDWLNQAQRDFEQAEGSHRAGRHEWACLAAHVQSGEAIAYASEVARLVRAQMAR